MSLPYFLAFLFDSTLITVCVYALVNGGRPERIGALINLGGTVATFVIRTQHDLFAFSSESIIFSVDVTVTAGFYWLSFTTIRFWPIWATGFALANLFMVLLGALLPAIPLFTYLTGLGIYAYLALSALMIGALRLPRNAEPYLRNGSRRSWLQHQEPTT